MREKRQLALCVNVLARTKGQGEAGARAKPCRVSEVWPKAAHTKLGMGP